MTQKDIITISQEIRSRDGLSKTFHNALVKELKKYKRVIIEYKLLQRESKLLRETKKSNIWQVINLFRLI